MKNRHPLKVFLLTLLTFGIYAIYWFYATRKEMITHGIKGIWPVIVLFIPVLALLSGLILWGLTPDAPITDDSLFGEPSPAEALLNTILWILMVIGVIAAFVVPLMWIYRYSKGVEVVTNGKFSRHYSFWMFVLLTVLGVPAVWPVIIQNEFNNIARSQPYTSPVPPHTRPPAAPIA